MIALLDCPVRFHRRAKNTANHHRWWYQQIRIKWRNRSCS